jgi:hypothetical protein
LRVVLRLYFAFAKQIVKEQSEQMIFARRKKTTIHGSSPRQHALRIEILDAAHDQALMHIEQQGSFRLPAEQQQFAGIEPTVANQSESVSPADGQKILRSGFVDEQIQIMQARRLRLVAQKHIRYSIGGKRLEQFGEARHFKIVPSKKSSIS